MTDAVAESDRYDSWCTILNDRFGRWRPEACTVPSFFARTDSRTLGGTQFVKCVCDPCAATRPRAGRADHGAQTFTFQHVVSGQERFEIGDERHTLMAGDILVWNDLHPMRFEVVERLHKQSVTIPVARLRDWLPADWHSLPSYFANDTPAAKVLSSLVSSTISEAINGGLRDGNAIADALIGVMVGVLGRERSSHANSLRNLHLYKAKSFIENNLSEPDLSPSVIAASAGISLRYLHHLFEDIGVSVQQYIVVQRLEKARQDLNNPAMRDRTVTDIALGWGFQSSAHFSRRFRAEYDLSPTDYRQIGR